jgi:hypothetical protein
VAGEPTAQASPVVDWRGTPITDGCVVVFPRKWGKNETSTEMVEAFARGFTETGRLRIEVIATSRPQRYEGQGLYAVPCHSVTVIEN